MSAPKGECAEEGDSSSPPISVRPKLRASASRGRGRGRGRGGIEEQGQVPKNLDARIPLKPKMLEKLYFHLSVNSKIIPEFSTTTKSSSF